MIEALICPNCGGHIDRERMICPYCGTKFKRDTDNLIRVETFSNPVRTYSTCLEVSDELVRYSNEDSAKMIIDRLSRELAKEIVRDINLEVEAVPERCSKRVRGNVRVVQNWYRY